MIINRASIKGSPIFVFMHGNYDSVAPFYDRLSKFVFRNSIKRSQEFLVDFVPANATILIVGGGTGKIVEWLTDKHNQGLEIVYVELSSKMISKAKKRNTAGNEISFINQSIQEAELENKFDIIITPFLFDNFLTSTVETVFEKLHQHLNEKGMWLYADFNPGNKKLWSKFLLKSMYLFFRITSKIEAVRLPATEEVFKRYGYEIIKQQSFYKNFITAIVYKKLEPNN